MKSPRWSYWIAGLYALALVLPLNNPLSRPEVYAPGIIYLICVPVVCVHPAWYANGVLLVGYISLAGGKYGWARNLGLVATALALTFFPSVLRFEDVGPAVYLWESCPILLAVAGHVLERGRVGKGKPTGDCWTDP